ncbi:MAG: hypothetical protein AAGU17_11440 [Anaerolineaceae bacterium]|jgi:hypothetical protein
MNNRNPSLLHILAAAFVVNFLLNLAGILQLVQSWNWLLAGDYTPHPLYAVFKNAFLALASMAAAGALWRRLTFAPRFSQVLSGLTFAWFWLDRLLLTRNPLPLRDHVFPLFISLILLGFFLVSAWLLEPFMRGLPGTPGDHEDEEVENA